MKRIGRLVPLLACVWLLALGCDSHREPPLFTDAQWKALSEGRPAQGELSMELTVIDPPAEGGRQLIAFELALKKDQQGKTVPVRVERCCKVVGLDSSLETNAICRSQALMAMVYYRASGRGSQAKVRLEGQQILCIHPTPEKPADGSKPAHLWLGEFRNVRLVDGRLHGELSLDKAAVMAEIDEALACSSQECGVVSWAAHAVLVISFDNRSLVAELPDRRSHALFSACGIVRDWMVRNAPE